MALSLQKGQQISLAKTSGTTLTTVRLGVGWEGIKKKGFLGFGAGREAVNLDANALLFDARGTLVDQVWFRQLARCATAATTAPVTATETTRRSPST